MIGMEYLNQGLNKKSLKMVSLLIIRLYITFCDCLTLLPKSIILVKTKCLV